jgi:hypothetical protein
MPTPPALIPQPLDEDKLANSVRNAANVAAFASGDSMSAAYKRASGLQVSIRALCWVVILLCLPRNDVLVRAKVLTIFNNKYLL